MYGYTNPSHRITLPSCAYIGLAVDNAKVSLVPPFAWCNPTLKDTGPAADTSPTERENRFSYCITTPPWSGMTHASNVKESNANAPFCAISPMCISCIPLNDFSPVGNTCPVRAKLPLGIMTESAIPLKNIAWLGFVITVMKIPQGAIL